MKKKSGRILSDKKFNNRYHYNNNIKNDPCYYTLWCIPAYKRRPISRE